MELVTDEKIRTNWLETESAYVYFEKQPFATYSIVGKKNAC